MKIKKGDLVKMLNGKDRGKQGKVIKVDLKQAKLAVEGLNIQKKHLRPRRSGEKGQVVAYPRLIDSSRVALICPQCNKITRVGHWQPADGKKLRRCHKCQATFV